MRLKLPLAIEHEEQRCLYKLANAFCHLWLNDMGNNLLENVLKIFVRLPRLLNPDD